MRDCVAPFLDDAPAAVREAAALTASVMLAAAEQEAWDGGGRDDDGGHLVRVPWLGSGAAGALCCLGAAEHERPRVQATEQILSLTRTRTRTRTRARARARARALCR